VSRGFAGALEAAWCLRFDRRIDACRELLPELRRQARAAEDRRDLLVFEASLARAAGDTASSARLLGAAGALLPGRADFQLSLQTGLNCFQQGDYSSALEPFLAARDCAANRRDRAAAIANLVFCLDNLGLHSGDAIAELKAAARGLPGPPADWGLRAQIDYFSLRHDFHLGRKVAARPRACDAQSGYFQSWVAELPYRVEYRRRRSRAAALVLSGDRLFCKTYRFRTLQGIWHPDERTPPSLKEWADRLYLWTWRWLAAPGEQPLGPVLDLLDGARLNESFVRLTNEDYQMVRNSIGWIALFHPRAASPLSRWIDSLKPTRIAPIPIFAFEHELSAFCRASRDGERSAAGIARRLRSQALSRASGTIWQQLLGSREPAPPLAAIHAQADLRRGGRRPLVRVEIGAHAVRTGHGCRVISPPLARALRCLARERAVPAARFLEETFGITNYDPLIHDTKIYNLLARIRGLFEKPAPVAIGMKHATVVSRGRWDRVEIVEPAADLGELPASLGAADRRVARERQYRPRLTARRLQAQPEFSRGDLEKAAGISRSSAHRLLQRWNASGWIRTVGRAKNRRYVWRSSQPVHPNN
jgi:hypothetical protein